ncbi:DnaJ domain-containing protein [Arthrobacter sp. UYEF20]|uniref:J domain-containing protein n=1 Tax=Arthrobacter sp. UYEF20 TaxID=1756363 RepID=UPI0033945620
MREHRRDPYDVLHLKPSATDREVTHAYRSLLRTRHPDTRPPETAPADRGAAGNAAADSGAAAEELHEIMDAYALLGDPARPTAYDREHQRQARSRVPEPAPPQTRKRRPASSAPLLFIGPVRWESPEPPDSGQQATGAPEPLHQERRLAPRIERSGPGRYRIIWQILP